MFSAALATGCSPLRNVKSSRPTFDVAEAASEKFEDEDRACEFFDWCALDRAETRERTRSLPARLRRTQRCDRNLPSPTELQGNLARSHDASSSDSEVPSDHESGEAVAKIDFSDKSLSDDAFTDSESARLEHEVDTATRNGRSSTSSVSNAGRDFKAYLEQRQPMHRLSTGGKASISNTHEPRPLAAGAIGAGSAWDFPLAKCEKRELLLLHMAAGERLAAAQAAEAEREAELIRQQLQSQGKCSEMSTNRGTKTTPRGSFSIYAISKLNLRRKRRSRRSSGHARASTNAPSSITAAGGC
eukprot:TRINITY_DN35833_c0_g1_i1.p1 TRINITY_DN35833_c0_g1~~TRINITY_DN35833_c0_g1_i1.p1  ORF type:complete len:301 (+),score=60.06 TRINITY_DN35833_c0_g1_i1:43-945(+)